MLKGFSGWLNVHLGVKIIILVTFYYWQLQFYAFIIPPTVASKYIYIH